MTQFQQEVLNWMGGSAVRFVGEWFWPEDIMRNKHLAAEMYWALVA